MLELRPHQVEVVEKINKGFEDGHRAQLLYAPTGFGKTEVAISLMQEIADKRQRVAMVMDRIVLVNQTSTRLARYQIQHGVMQAVGQPNQYPPRAVPNSARRHAG